MKIIATNGITYLEQLEGSTEWYWGSNYTNGDLYEAEEIYYSGKQFKPNRLIFVHYPDGQVVEPIPAKDFQYFGRPAYSEGSIYVLLVDFHKKEIRLERCSDDLKIISNVVSIPLSEVEDCYNLLLHGNPIMITRQGGDETFQVIWPDKTEFAIDCRETFVGRQGDKLLFSEWHEDPEYREELNVRDYSTGALLEKIDGAERTMPNDEHWILR